MLLCHTTVNRFTIWTESLEKGISVDVLYLDFSKVLESVPHEWLLLKLKVYGLQGKVLLWIRSFLSERKQAAVINGVKSRTTSVLSGVPQGSVIDPLLFLIYINDLPSQVSSQVLLFADDVKLYCPIVNQQSSCLLEQDIDH